MKLVAATAHHKLIEPLLFSFIKNCLIRPTIKKNSHTHQKNKVGISIIVSGPFENKIIAAANKRWLQISLFKIKSIVIYA
jgi:hypothetical protein